MSVLITFLFACCRHGAGCWQVAHYQRRVLHVPSANRIYLDRRHCLHDSRLEAITACYHSAGGAPVQSLVVSGVEQVDGIVTRTTRDLSTIFLISHSEIKIYTNIHIYHICVCKFIRDIIYLEIYTYLRNNKMNYA